MATCIASRSCIRSCGPADYQITRTTPAPRMSASRVNSGRSSARAAAQINKFEWIATKSEFVSDTDLLGGHVEGLIRRVAEQIVEEATDGAPEIHARHTRQQADLPHDNRRNVDDRLLTLAALEHRCRL